jgi:predicted Zn-dependent protease with MMP-like domain
VIDFDDFERFVDEALLDIPAVFRGRLHNLAIVVEDWPDRETMRVAGIQRPGDLLGFYHGVPLTQRTQGYTMVTPDKISIYRSPILIHCRRTGGNVRATVHHVLRHELAHYFGIDDDRLEELGAY